MATEVTTEMATPEKIDPQIVGNAFVEQYYQILHQSPELVHRFYQDSSVLSRLDANGLMKTVTTLGAINDQIMSVDYKKFKAEIKTADAQQSYNDGVIVLVTGYLTGRDNLRRKFTETFFLAPQEKGFYVLNDIFRYVDENESQEVNSVAVNGINDSTQAVPTLDQEPTHVPEVSVLDPPTSFEEDDLNNGAEVCDPSDNGEGSVTEKEVVIEQHEAPPHLNQNETPAVVNAAPALQDEAPKKSYASIVKVMKGHAMSNTMYVPAKTIRAALLNTDRQLVGLAKLAPAPEAYVPTTESAPGSSHSQEEVEGHSIYLRNLPSNASAPQLEEEFKKFGPIKRGGIQIRSNKQTGFVFGFVEFETLSAMHSAIEASPITIGGRQADIEEKRTTTRAGGGGGRGRYPSGRGGFRNDNFRGRGNFGGGSRGGYGGGRNPEFRNQGGEFSGRPRGPNGRSGEGYQWVDQNGNGRPSGRQGGGSGGAAAGSGGGNNSSVPA